MNESIKEDPQSFNKSPSLHVWVANLLVYKQCQGKIASSVTKTFIHNLIEFTAFDSQLCGIWVATSYRTQSSSDLYTWNMMKWFTISQPWPEGQRFAFLMKTKAIKQKCVSRDFSPNFEHNSSFQLKRTCNTKPVCTCLLLKELLFSLQGFGCSCF